MSLIARNDELILAVNKKLIAINTNNRNVMRNIELSSNIVPKAGLNPTGPEGAREHEQPPKTGETTTINKIQQIKLSPDGQYLAISTAGRKLLLLYKVCSDSLEFLSARRISRASSGLAFSPDSTQILVCDKTGDCYMFGCKEYDSPGKWVLGHLSMVLDILFTPNQNAIVTSDRDEKIRVTNFPDAHEIECYCLGHTEYVSSINFLPSHPNEYLASLSGDRTLKLWKYQTGQRVHEIVLPAPGIKFVARQLDATVCHIAVLLFQPDESLFLYRLQTFETSFESSMISSHSFPGTIITDLDFSNDVLYLTTSTDGRLGLEALRYENGVYQSTDTTGLNELIRPVFQNEEITDLEDVSGWFKKKFDNLTEYLERKKRRIEEKQQSKSNSILCS